MSAKGINTPNKIGNKLLEEVGSYGSGGISPFTGVKVDEVTIMLVFGIFGLV
jgi:hypothetical protein